MSMYKAGYSQALQNLGISKTARNILRSPWGTRARRWIQKKMPTRSGVRDFFIGNPRRFGQEIVEGKALGKGGLLRESFYAPDTFSKVMFYGLPAVEAAGIALDQQGDKAKRLGETVGGTALGLAAYRPLGMVGSIAADTLGRSLGGGIGKTVGHAGSKVKEKLNLGSEEESAYTSRGSKNPNGGYHGNF